MPAGTIRGRRRLAGFQSRQLSERMRTAELPPSVPLTPVSHRATSAGDKLRELPLDIATPRIAESRENGSDEAALVRRFSFG